MSRSLLLRTVLRSVAAAAVGFVMIAIAAVLLQTDHRRANPGLDGLGPAIDLVFIWVCALPLVGWALLRVVGARPAWAVSLTGAVLLLPVLVVFNRPGGLNFAAWQYGLEGFLAYGIAALICLPLAAALSGHGHEPSSASHELDGEQREAIHPASPSLSTYQPTQRP